MGGGFWSEDHDWQKTKKFTRKPNIEPNTIISRFYLSEIYLKTTA